MCVGHTKVPAKTAEQIEMLFGGWFGCMGPRNRVLEGVDIPTGKDSFIGGLFGPLKSIITACCGVRSKCHHSILPNSSPCDAVFCQKNPFTICWVWHSQRPVLLNVWQDRVHFKSNYVSTNDDVLQKWALTGMLISTVRLLPQNPWHLAWIVKRQTGGYLSSQLSLGICSFLVPVRTQEADSWQYVKPTCKNSDQSGCRLKSYHEYSGTVDDDDCRNEDNCSKEQQRQECLSLHDSAQNTLTSSSSALWTGYRTLKSAVAEPEIYLRR